ncbi:class A beta-lactamase, subclass A2 [Flavobacterium sp. 5]|uniref:class A beta-lactamase, subclass A2 n=1 Tax=Flavobacterium sp. 5 TaxID=2035199 RepID=UPI000C2B90BA|nr:class A beta-lactamase, subclass A2 [Flavobacterium sp. 5]PKB15855.1 beta-lactamase class A VEB [Flavobacterium sp. 5]
MKRKTALTTALLLTFVFSNAQVPILKSKIENILKGKKATVGVSIVANHYKDTLNINGNEHLPMQSVYKFPIALAVLSEIDKKKFTLHQKIKITKNELPYHTWSPIRDEYPNGVTLTISDILRYTVSQSDNNGCDILLRFIGGTKVVEDYLSENKLTNISIKTTEEEMHQEWDVQYQNWATPIALNTLLIKSYDKTNTQILSKENYKFLWKAMTETSTGLKRLRGQLPKKTIVAHKTGLSGTNDKNVTAATNDIGVIVLPNGEPIFITVLVSDSTENAETNEKIISDIAKATWDYYLK